MKNEVKLKKDQNLEDIFLNDKKIKFPECIDIKLSYENIRKELKKYHDNADSNPSIISLKEIIKEIQNISNEDSDIDHDKLKKINKILDNEDYFIFLNKHGSIHVQHVIENASKILSYFNSGLNSLEIFVLLSAIQLHDSALVYGRFNHEININTIMNKEINKYINDVTLSNIIFQVASTHSGKVKYDNDKVSKDVIDNKSSKLDYENNDFLNFPIRSKLLAAILRFADEISDDYRRVNEQALKDNMLGVSEIYHEYSKSVRNILIYKDDKNHNILKIHYRIDKKLINKKFKKTKEKEIFLIDEIFNRTKKMELERRYCMRFMRDYFYIYGIEVIIKIVNYTDDNIDESNFESGAYTVNNYSEHIVSYSLYESGYPEEDFKENEKIINIESIIEELNKKGWDIKNEY